MHLYWRAKWLDTNLIESGPANSGNTIDLAGIIIQVQQSLHSQEEDLSEQYIAMEIELRARAQCIAANSQGLYKGEEFIPCDSDLDLNTTTAGTLVTWQRVKVTLDNLDKDLDQRLQATDPPSQRQRGLIKASQHNISHS